MVRVSLAGRVNRNPKEERYVLDDVQQNSRAATVEERAESRTHHQSAPAGLAVCGLGLTLHSGAELLRDVNFAAAPGTLTAIIGSSGAGKTILAGLVGGMICPSRGTVTFAGYNVHADFSRLRRRIGLVPQDPPLLAPQASSILTGGSTKDQFSGVSGSRRHASHHLPPTQFLAVSPCGGNRAFGPRGRRRNCSEKCFRAATVRASDRGCDSSMRSPSNECRRRSPQP